jgi:hypothetical protein
MNKILLPIFFLLTVSAISPSFLQDAESDALALDLQTLLDEAYQGMSNQEYYDIIAVTEELLESLDDDETVVIAGGEKDDEDIDDFLQDLEENKNIVEDYNALVERLQTPPEKGDDDDADDIEQTVDDFEESIEERVDVTIYQD